MGKYKKARESHCTEVCSKCSSENDSFRYETFQSFTMAHLEIDSFVLKFRNLCSAGYNATLSVEAENGKASICLKADLGNIPPSFPHPHSYGPPSRSHRGPSYHRRQERRKAAAAAATLDATNKADKAGIHNDGAEIAPSTPILVSEEDIEVDKEADENIETDETVQSAEKLDTLFECPICDFTSKWKNGLNVHLSRKHSKLDQLDGFSDTDDPDKKYDDTIHYWKTGWLGTMYHSFLTANDIIDSSDMTEDLKKIEKEKILQARKTAFGSSFNNFPPWNK